MKVLVNLLFVAALSGLAAFAGEPAQTPKDAPAAEPSENKVCLDAWSYSRERKTVTGSNRVTARLTLKNVTAQDLEGVSVAVTFLLYKLMQLGALVWFGLFDWPLFLASAGLTVVALGGFALGLRVQDRLEQATFNRLVLAFLGALGLWLVVRALR
jgi:hypothetical protein